jgi:phage-related minor tail protein
MDDGRLKTDGIEEAQSKYNRALLAFVIAQNRAIVSARTQLGVASEQEMLTQRLVELNDLEMKGYIRSAEEKALAERILRKEVRETYEQMLVRASATPQLTRLSLDAAKLTTNLDEGLAGALRGSTSAMIEMAKGTKTLGQGFTELAQRIADAVLQAVLLKAIVGPISGGISSMLGLGGGIGPWETTTTIFPSARGNIFAGGGITPFAQGGLVTRPTLFPMRNGWGLMGEAGEEAVMPLRRLGGGRLGVSAEGMRPQVLVQHQVINNHPTARVSQRDEDDGRGGRRTLTVIDEMMAKAASQPGSKSAAAFGRSRTLVRR